MKKHYSTRLISLIMTLAFILTLSLGCMTFASADSTTPPEGTYFDGNADAWIYYLDGGNAIIIGSNASDRVNVVIPSDIEEHPVTGINDVTSTESIFGGTSGTPTDFITSITIPDSVTSIGRYAFQYCTVLSAITLPESIASIGTNAFAETGIAGMENITFPAREGYTLSWNMAQDGGGDVVEDILTAMDTVYAIWSPEIYTVTLESGAGTLEGDDTVTVTFDAAYDALPEPVPDFGYVFTGWNMAEDGSGATIGAASIVNIPSDHMLYAQYEAGDYTLYFDAQGGTVEPASKTVTYNAEIGELPTPERAGYTFTGWNTAADGEGDTVTDITVYDNPDDMTLYAQWQANHYTVTLGPQGGDIVPLSLDVIFGETYVDLPSSGVRDGYTFACWNTAADGSGDVITGESVVSIPDNHTLYAQWEANLYTVTFDPNGGELTTADTTITVTYNDVFGTLLEATREGYEFFKWNTAADGSGAFIGAEDAVVITEDTTLYALWNANEYIVTFDPQDGELTTADTTITVTFGEAYGALLVAAKDGYTFDGWFTEPDGEGVEITAGTIVSISDDHTLYANWISDTPEAPNPGFPPAPPAASEPSNAPVEPEVDTDTSAHANVPNDMIQALNANSGAYIVAVYTDANGVRHIIPGRYDPETGTFIFLYDNLPEDADISFELGEEPPAPNGVSEDHYAYDSIVDLLENGIIDSEDEINPESVSTRDSLISMLFKCVFQASASDGFTSDLTDVTDDDAMVLWAMENGIIKGFPDNTFRSDAPLTRQEVFVIVARFLNAYNPIAPSDEDEGPAFADIDEVADWALADIKLLARYGLISGTDSDGNILVMPDKEITDGELYTLIARILNADF